MRLVKQNCKLKLRLFFLFLKFPLKVVPLLLIHFPFTVHCNSSVVCRKERVFAQFAQSCMNSQQGIVQVLHVRIMVLNSGIGVNRDTKGV